MALSPDGSMLAFVSPDEASGANYGKRSAYRRERSNCSTRHRRRELPVLVTGQYLCGVLRGWQAKKGSGIRRNATDSCHRGSAACLKS